MIMEVAKMSHKIPLKSRWLSLGVERFTELHDVNTVLTQCGANRWTGICLSGFNLKLNISLYLLCHFTYSSGSNAARLPV